MNITIKNIRAYNKWSLEIASKLFKIEKERLIKLEDYKEVPTYNEVVNILKAADIYYDDTVGIIFNDIDMHLRLKQLQNVYEKN